MAVVSIIEDDPRIRAGLVRALGERGHVVKPVATGMDGLRVVVDEAPDAVVLDLGLPDMDGTEVLRMIRAVSQVPVIVATARDDEAEIVRLLDEGADDYVVKPFSGEQLDARIRAVLGRAAATVEAGPLVVGGLHIDSRAREASLDGRPSTSPARSSTSWPTWPPGPAWWSPRPSSWPRSGASPTEGPTRRWTSTCRGCAASWARRPPSPVTCGRCGVWA